MDEKNFFIKTQLCTAACGTSNILAVLYVLAGIFSWLRKTAMGKNIPLTAQLLNVWRCNVTNCDGVCW